MGEPQLPPYLLFWKTRERPGRTWSSPSSPADQPSRKITAKNFRALLENCGCGSSQASFGVRTLIPMVPGSSSGGYRQKPSGHRRYLRMQPPLSGEQIKTALLRYQIRANISPALSDKTTLPGKSYPGSTVFIFLYRFPQNRKQNCCRRPSAMAVINLREGKHPGNQRCLRFRRYRGEHRQKQAILRLYRRLCHQRTPPLPGIF